MRRPRVLLADDHRLLREAFARLLEADCDVVAAVADGRAVLEEMTEVTGGKAYFPNSVYELEDICVKIALELKNQYVLGYSSTNPAKDGRWRKIKVKLNAPKGAI